MPGKKRSVADEIKTIHNTWLQAELRGDSAGLLQLCAPVPVWLPPNEPPLCGKAAILQWLEDQPKATILQIQIDDLQIFETGPLACKLASFRTTIDGPANDGATVVTGTHAWLLQRDASGTWQIAVVTWTIMGAAG